MGDADADGSRKEPPGRWEVRVAKGHHDVCVSRGRRAVLGGLIKAPLLQPSRPPTQREASHPL